MRRAAVEAGMGVAGMEEVTADIQADITVAAIGAVITIVDTIIMVAAVITEAVTAGTLADLAITGTATTDMETAITIRSRCIRPIARNGSRIRFASRAFARCQLA